MRKVIATINLIFEVSWEVCNKVGGIYTVLSSKSNALCDRYPDKVIFIGPLLDTPQQKIYFSEDKKVPSIFNDINLPMGLTYKTGSWNIPGNPTVVLVDFKPLIGNLNSFYGDMWERYGVDSLHAYGDYEESCAFAIAASMFIGAVCDKEKKSTSQTVALFNEWTTGMGLLWLKTNYPNVATLFTTHATSIGRSICGNNKPLYGYFEGYNGDQMAGELNMQSKHSLEKQAAWNADCFTAVSELTAREAGQLLEIRPAVVTPNGFEKKIAGTPAQRGRNRSKSREKILDIASKLLHKKLPESTFIVGISGRNEYRNKGLDVFLDVVDSLRSVQNDKNLLFLIMVPAWVKEPRADLKEGRPEGNRLLTHWLNNQESDAILCRMEQLNLNDDAEANVNAIYLPCYLDGQDGILNIDYYTFLPALDLTVFPSYYEPWGYTPLESIAFGVPTVTTSLSGFGQWVEHEFPQQDIDSTGVAVIERDDFNYHGVVAKISGLVARLSKMPSSSIQKVRRNAFKTASRAEWDLFIDYYVEAYNKALETNKNNRKN